MTISGRSLGDHFRLSLACLGILTAVWALRLLAGAVEIPFSAVRLISVTLGVEICLVLLVVQIHLRHFGGYASVFLCSLILNAWAQMLICSAVGFAWLTGTSNIFTHPAFLMTRPDPNLLLHIYGQLTFVLGYMTLVAACTGCLLLCLLRFVLPHRTSQR